MDITFAGNFLVIFSASNSQSIFFLLNWTGQKQIYVSISLTKYLNIDLLRKKKKKLPLQLIFMNQATPESIIFLGDIFCEELMLKPLSPTEQTEQSQSWTSEHQKLKRKIKCSYWLNTRTMFRFYFLKAFKTFSSRQSFIEKQCCGTHVCMSVCAGRIKNLK